MHKAVVEHLGENPRALADRALDAPLGDLVAFLRYAREAGEGLALAVPLALEATKNCRLPEWRNGYRLYGLGYTASALSDKHSCRLHGFLNALCDSKWLASQLRQAKTGSLAGTLYALWSCLPEGQLRRFSGHLRQMAFTPRHHRKCDTESIGKGLCLVGTASLFHISVPKNVAELYVCQPVAPLICVTQPQSPRKDITARQVQLWLGLRAISISTYPQESISVPPTLGDEALARWRASCPKLQKHAALNKVMIAWLNRCYNAQWHLIDDTKPLPQ